MPLTTMYFYLFTDNILIYMWHTGLGGVFNDTFNNISVILWQAVLLVEENGENHRPVASNWQILSHNVISSTERDSNSQR